MSGWIRTFSWAALVVLLSPWARAQTTPQAKQAIEAAVQSELRAADADHSLWMYRDHDTTAGKDAVYVSVDTPQGSLRRMVLLNGQPLTPEQREAESARIDKFVNDAAEQSKEHKASSHDDDQAAKMLRMLPNAFIWTVESQTPEAITLAFRPDPNFDPPDMEARVMGMMAGQMIIARKGNRIRTLRGRLTEDVKIGFGVLGRLNQGGTFDVERREVAPGLWEITETRVHIGGHALLFKTIGQQEDEIKVEWKPTPANNLRQAEDVLREAR